MERNYNRIDMHIHTTASDGTWDPAKLIEKLKMHSIDIFAITDHDTTENIEVTAKLAKERGLRFIPGVEINVSYNGFNYHILGFGIIPGNHELQAVLEKNRAVMEQIDDESINYLNAQNKCVSINEYKEYVNIPERGGWKALNYLIDKGICASSREFFCLFQEKLNLFEKLEFVTAHEAIEAVRKAGGIPVLAHPGAAFYSKDYKATISYMLSQGICGIECFHPENSAEITRYCLEVCDIEGIAITGGSDCHGDFIKSRRLGTPELDLSMLKLEGINF